MTTATEVATEPRPIAIRMSPSQDAWAGRIVDQLLQSEQIVSIGLTVTPRFELDLPGRRIQLFIRRPASNHGCTEMWVWLCELFQWWQVLSFVYSCEIRQPPAVFSAAVYPDGAFGAIREIVPGVKTFGEVSFVDETAVDVPIRALLPVRSAELSQDRIQQIQDKFRCVETSTATVFIVTFDELGQPFCEVLCP